MSNHKKHKPLKRQHKRGFSRLLYSWFSSGFQIVLLLLILIATLAVISQMRETQTQNKTLSSFDNNDTVQPLQPASQGYNKDIFIANTESSPRLAVDTKVLIYTDKGNKGWQSTPLGEVGKGQEFQFGNELYVIDLNGALVRRHISLDKLAEADRMFEANNRRFPEENDVVRFVDAEFHHIRHDWMRTARPGDKFLFQGQVYECLAHPDNPDIHGYQSTQYVLAPPSEMAVVDAIVDLNLRRDNDDKEFFVTGSPQDPYFVPALNDNVLMGELKAGMTFRSPDDGSLVTVVSSKTRHGRFVVHKPTYLTPINPLEAEIVAKATPVEKEIAPNMASDASAFVEELAQAQDIKVNSFNLAAQVTQAQAVPQSNISPTDFGFTGQRQEGFGLIDYGGRFYDPILGRFISPDPIIPGVGNPQVLNHYSYVKNNPIRYTDPKGNYCWGQRGCAVVGAIIIVAEAVDPFPLEVGSIPLGGSMIASDPLVTQDIPLLAQDVPGFLAMYGPQMPAYWDTFSQLGRNIRQSLDKGGDAGNTGNANPNNLPNGPEFQRNQYLTNAQKQTPWGRYQQLVTGKDYEEVWRLSNGKEVRLDAINEGYLVETKWGGQNVAAWESSPLNRFFDAPKTLDQLSRQVQFAQEHSLNGVRWAISNEAGANFFRDFVIKNYPDLYNSGFIQVMHVPGNGM